MAHSNTKTKTVKRLGCSLVAFFLVLLVLPEVIRIGVQYGFEELSADTAVIEDVDLNLFTGELAVTGLNLHYGNAQTLSLGELVVDIDLLALFSQRILVEQVDLKRVELKAYNRNKQWVVALPIPESTDEVKDEPASEPSAWKFGINNILLDSVVVSAEYEGQQHQIRIGELWAEQLMMWQPEHQSEFRLQGELNGAPFNFNGGLKPFAESRTFELAVKLDSFDLSPVQQFLPSTIQQLNATLNVDSILAVMLNPKGDITLTQKGVVALSVDAVSVPDMTVAVDDIHWDGQIDVAVPKGEQPQVQAQGGLKLAGVVADYSPLEMRVSANRLKWQGSASVDVAAPETSVSSKADLQINAWKLEDLRETGLLAGYDELTLAGIGLAGLSSISTDQITLTQLTTLNKDTGGKANAQKGLISLGELRLSKLLLEHQHKLQINDVQLKNIEGNLTRNGDGKVAVLDDWMASLTARAQSQDTADSQNKTGQATTEEKEPFEFRIGKIQIVGENNVRLNDRSVTPHVIHPIKVKQFVIGEIHSGNPGAVAPVDIAIGLYDYGSITVKGGVSLLQPLAKMNGDIEAEIKGVELPVLSQYIESTTGYQVNSGQLKVTSAAKMDVGKLDSNTNVKMLRVDLEPVDEELIDKLSTQLTMPVDTALSVITDSDDTLSIDIPVKGDLSNPDIKLNTIITGALLQAVQNAAFTYFKYAVQPFGAILLVSEKIGDMQLQAKFEDVKFIPGKPDIVAEQSGYLEKVAAMVKEKDAFSIMVCVVVTDQDFAAREVPIIKEEGASYEWDEISTQLAKARLNLIKSELIHQYELDTDRVQTCRPQIDKGQPRAIMGI